jgi:hypothetical protein
MDVAIVICQIVSRLVVLGWMIAFAFFGWEPELGHVLLAVGIMGATE